MNDFKLIETKWQKYWEQHPEISRAENESKKEKKYILVEFPYPSGSGLHVGHAFSFTGGDVYARFNRMMGYNVLFPMGWDAFGLPTENYAIKMKRKPQEVTRENTDHFRSQMKKLAYSFDWDREVNTTDPNYYKWTQWIFIQLFKKGLAYKKEMPINWCPSCKIGLANEEVVDGKCERCGAEVSRRNVSQWVVKITEYADKLIEGLKETDFIEKVKQQQINWIGKSEGAKVKFKIAKEGRDVLQNVSTDYLEVFTTRPDTLFGATFMVIAPEHELVSQIISSPFVKGESGEAEWDFDLEAVKDYVKNARKKSDMERTELSKDKTGVFSGLYAINPVNDKQIPIWISDFVLASYGTGAIMSVPAHDERDFAFAKKFDLEIIPVIKPKEEFDFEKEAYAGDGVLMNSEFLNGLNKEEAIKKMLEWIKKKGIGEATSSFHLRDWIFSRQHYWGEPIPMIKCPKCGWVPVPDDQLPIVLPEVEAYEPTDDGKSPLSKIDSFVKCKCSICDGEAERETDTMPNWAGSDWYFLGYVLANKINNGLGSDDIVNDIFSASQKELEYWSPVDVYIGGDEHNVLHLLYSRFIYKFLWDLGVLPKDKKEPYYKRMSHGVILGPDNQRMSKSKGNVIVPETVADKYGVDVVRMYLMFMGPFDSTMAWNENTLMGVKRFLDRFNQFINFQFSIFNQDSKEIDSSREVKVIINKLIKGVTDDLSSFKYNTAIAKMMEAVNKMQDVRCKMLDEDIKTLIKLIAPLAPYMAEELWSLIVETHDRASLQTEYRSVHLESWPEVDEKYLVEEMTVIMVAINGKVRSQLKIETKDINNKEMILEMVKKDEAIIKWVGDKKIMKEIYVPGKMVNLVVV